MGSLYLDRKNLLLKLNGHALALYEGGVKKGAMLLHCLDSVVLRGHMQLESNILGALSGRGLVLVKIRGQQKLLQRALLVRADLRYPLSPALQARSGVLAQLRDEVANLRLPVCAVLKARPAGAIFGVYRCRETESFNLSVE